MKKVTAILIAALAVVGVLFVNLFGMHIDSAYDKIIQAERIEIQHEKAYQDKYHGFRKTLDVNFKESDSFIIYWQVYPDNATYRNAKLSIRLATSEEVSIDETGLVKMHVRKRIFLIVAQTTSGTVLYDEMYVNVTV